MRVPGRAAPFLRTIRESNRQGRDGWDRYAGHRRRLTRLLRSVAPPGGTIGVLGAGNLNDLDLRALLPTCRALHLVDIDGETVHAGLARQGLTSSATIAVHSPIDLTGILDSLPVAGGVWSESARSRFLDVLAERRLVVPGAPFDVSISPCALTQLLQSVVESGVFPADRPQVSLALRDRHLEDLLRLTRPGGITILATDVVSTTTAPGLLQVSAIELEDVMARLIAAGNFFTGTNPYRIAALLEEDPRYRDRVDAVRIVDPWLWPVTRDRQHLTCAIVVSRRDDSAA
jgi:hypothetical protein